MTTILLERFDKFWINYPKKRNKGSAKKIWLRIKPDDNLLKKMLAKIMEAKRSKEWRKDNGQFIPYPATWLNAECWEDEFDKPTPRAEPKDYTQTEEERKKADEDFRTGKTLSFQEVGRRLMKDIKGKKGK